MAELSHRTWPLVRRLVGQFLWPHLPRMGLAFLAMSMMAAATATNAWLMQPMLDRVFVARDERLLFVIPIAIIALALVKGVANYVQAVLMTTNGPARRRRHPARALRAG